MDSVLTWVQLRLLYAETERGGKRKTPHQFIMQMEVFVVVFTPCHKTTNTVAGVVQALMSYSLQSAYRSILSYIRVDTVCVTLPPSPLLFFLVFCCLEKDPHLGVGLATKEELPHLGRAFSG